jgi:AcrR family transcriptional regulator
MPKGFTEHEKELIRQRLIKEGYRQFSAYGLKKTNVEELAAAAKISKGAFYLFYESKEALFMDVAEWAEQRYRQEILAAIDLPGSSPRARLLAVFKQAFALLKTIPILRFFTGSDYDLLFRRIPPEKLQEHLASDRIFFAELVARCRNAGIPIRVQPDEISQLMYPLVLAMMHEDDFGQNNLSGSIDSLLELVAAFCLGEVDIQFQEPVGPAPERTGAYYELAD